jgi:dipeptidyl aminopeptidase/acylaminoacyl peptidase
MLEMLFAVALQTAASVAPLHDFSGVVLDPAGRRIASIETDWTPDQPATAHGELVVRNRMGAVLEHYHACDHCRYEAPAFSPDGNSIALIGGDAHSVTVYLIERGRVQTLTHIDGLATNLRWAPDGASLALLVTLHPAKENGATQAGARQTGEVSAASTDARRIAVLSRSGGALSFASPDGVFVYEYDWTPDGRGFVATSAAGDGDANWWVAKLVAYDRDGHGHRDILAPAYQMAAPRVSPDGRSVAFIGAVMSDFGSTGGDVFVAPIAGGTPVNLTPDYAGSFSSIAWRGTNLIATLVKGGENSLARIDPATHRVALMATGAYSMTAGDGRVSLDAQGAHAAYATESFEHASEIAFGALGHGRPITHANAQLGSSVGGATSVAWDNEGFHVQGWLLRPRAAAPAGGYPMITVIHGGPSSAATPRFDWNNTNRALLDAGYALFLPNPRGSYGQGARFTNANHRDFGGGDLRDILKGIDAVERVAPVNEARLGVYGRSYGGFMTMWTVTHSQRFRAAIAGQGIANWVSYYGQNGISTWMVPFFGASVYDDAAIYDQLSPIRTIKNAHTPTLLLVGERDVETPAAQSMEFYRGLLAQGVATSLVIYDGEGHAIRDPAHIVDQNRRIVAWFDRYLAASSAPRPQAAN